eukprot:c36737_g1_i1 orf=1-303(-)
MTKMNKHKHSCFYDTGREKYLSRATLLMGSGKGPPDTKIAVNYQEKPPPHPSKGMPNIHLYNSLHRPSSRFHQSHHCNNRPLTRHNTQPQQQATIPQPAN